VRRPFGLIVPLLGTCALIPVGLLIVIGERDVMPPMWVHFYGVGVSALVATAAAVALTTVAADFAVVLGIVLLACALYGALILYYMELRWWLGHIFEMLGILVVGSLDDDEYAVIKLHPERARELLKELGGFDENVGRLVLDHHERLDGSGYPRGLEGSDLDLATRILAVCDVYDALVSPHVYRPAWPQEDALSLLRDEADIAFDSRCIAALEPAVTVERSTLVSTPSRSLRTSPSLLPRGSAIS
jgi:hypothetical protein